MPDLDSKFVFIFQNLKLESVYVIRKMGLSHWGPKRPLRGPEQEKISESWMEYRADLAPLHYLKSR